MAELRIIPDMSTKDPSYCLHYNLAPNREYGKGKRQTDGGTARKGRALKRG